MRFISIPQFGSPQLFRNPGGVVALVGADYLLTGETDGMASDFTESTGVGYVSVLDVATPANVVSNVIGDAWWTNSGTSPKLINTSAGALAWSPHNMCLQSATFGTTWTASSSSVSANSTTDPLGTSTADTLTATNVATSFPRVNQTGITFIAGATYTVSVYMKAGTSNYGAFLGYDGTVIWGVIFNLSNGTHVTDRTGSGTIIDRGISNAGGGWYRCYVSFAATATSGQVQIGHSLTGDASFSESYAGTETIYLWGAQVNRGVVHTAHLATTTAARYGLGIDYSGGSYGLLVEPAATNLVLRSQEFDNAYWSEDQVGTIAAGSITAPDGTATAETLTSLSGTNEHLVYPVGKTTISTGTNYTFSIYVKKNTNRYVAISLQDATDEYITAVFDLDGGGSAATETSAGATSGTIVSTSQVAIGSGWYRIALTGSLTATGVYHWVGFTDAASGNTFTSVGQVTFAAAGTESIYIWGAQLELGTVATSHIPTFAATVTRAVDNVSKVLTALPYSQTVGSFFIDYKINGLNLGSAFQKAFVIHDGSAANLIQIQPVLGGNEDYQVTTASVAQVSSTLQATPAAGTRTQSSVAWQANNFAGTSNGAALVTDGAGTVPGSQTILTLGDRHDAARCLHGRIRRVVYVPRRVTDGDLPTWRYNF